MEPQPLEQIIDIPSILEHIVRLRNLVDQFKSEYTGTKLAYIERLWTVLESLQYSVKEASYANTSTQILVSIRGALISLDKELERAREAPLNWDDISTHTDELLSQMPFTGLGVSKVRVYEDAISKSESEFRANVEKKVEEVDTLVEFVKDKISWAQDRVIAESDIRFKTLEETIGKTEKLAHFVSGKALSNEFTEQAKKQRTGKWLWTAGTWIMAVATLEWLGIFLYWHLKSEIVIPNAAIDVSLLTTKVLITLTLGLLTRWTSKRANHNLSEEARYRRLALNMDTLDSFVGNLDDYNRNKVVAFVAAKILSDYPSGGPDAEFDSLSLGELMRAIANKPVEKPPKVDLL